MDRLLRRVVAPAAAMMLVLVACDPGEDIEGLDDSEGAIEVEEADDEEDASDTDAEEADAEADGDESTLRIARPDDVRALNPLRQANNATSEVTYQIHEGLVTLNPDQELEPVLATDWEVLDDGRTYRIYLREDVEFHSGEPFDAEAVKWNFEKQLFDDPPGIASGLLPEHEEIEVVDDHTIDMVLAEENGVYMNILGAPLFMMMDPTQWEELGEEGYDQDPSGTGPFKFDDWSPDERVELVANEDYWDQDNGPAVDRIVFEVMPEASSRVIALQNREVDMIFTLPAEDVPGLQESDEHDAITVPSTRLVFIGFNTADPILEDLEVRRALAHATDRDQVDEIIGDNGVAVDGIGTPNAEGFFPSAQPFDADEAERLLDEAGWERSGDGIRERDGESLSIEVMSAATAAGEEQALQVVQQQWEQVGAELEIQQLDGGALNERIEEEATAHEEDSSHVPDYQGFMLASGIRTGEVGYILGRPQCDQVERNHHRFCDPEYDEAFQVSQSTAPDEERMEGYETMARIFEEEVLRLPLYITNVNVGVTDAVNGFEVNPNEALDLRGVTVEQ